MTWRHKEPGHQQQCYQTQFSHNIPDPAPEGSMPKLQSCLYTAIKPVTKTKKYDHISPVSKELNLLPAQAHNRYQVLLIVFVYIHGLPPACLGKNWSKTQQGLQIWYQLPYFHYFFIHFVSLPPRILKIKTYGFQKFLISMNQNHGMICIEILACLSLLTFRITKTNKFI